MTIEVPLDQIVVGDRCREDYGNIEAFAKNLQRDGLLQAIVVDRNGQENSYRLVAGGRRLAAARLLKWPTIRAELLEQLTDEKRDHLELRENLDRKDLTSLEASRKIIAKAQLQAAEKNRDIISTQNESKKDPRGRPATYGNKAKPEIAKEIGVARESLQRAERHVELADRYPFLRSWRQGDVLQFREHIKKMPPEEQNKLCEFIVQDHLPMHPRPDQALTVAQVMRDKTPEARAAIYKLAKSTDAKDRTLATTRSRELPPMPDGRLMILSEALDRLRKTYAAPFDSEPEAVPLRNLTKQLTEIRNTIKIRYEDLKEKEESHVKEDKIRRRL